MQITDLQMVHKEQWQFIYTTIYCGCQYKSVDILYFWSLKKATTLYLRIKCVLQAHHENNAYCVRIKSVLFLRRMTNVHPRVHGKRSGLPLCKLLD